jgi:biopolymer transport protein ExbB
MSSLPAWIIATQWASRLILIVLVGLSVWSVAIMVDRFRALKWLEASDALEGAKKLITARDWTGLAQWTSSHPGLRSGTLQAAMSVAKNGNTEQIDRSVRSYLALERASLEKGLTALATLGSNAPFIGLFGTVLGIIQAFGALAIQNNNTTSVMTGISEALVATAIGLFVAIPAVIAYNVLSRKLRLLLTECESLRDLYLSRVEK